MPFIPAIGTASSMPLAAASLAALLAVLPAGAAAQEPTTACVPGQSLLADLSAEERAAIDREAADVPNGEGRLFRIEREGVSASYLFGTMHLSDPRVTALSPAAEAAFREADSLVVETLDIADEAKMASTVLSRPDLTTLPGGQDLLDLLPQERRAELERRLDELGMPAASVRSLQPWFVTVALVMPACETERMREGLKVLDLALHERAGDEGKSLHGLETGAEQLEAMADLPLALQAENLAATIDLLPRLPDIFETMIELYAAGRIAAISPAIETLAPSGTSAEASAAVYTAFEERVVTERNHTMSTRLQPLLAEGDAFVAVGALHLPGETGLVELLRDEGWTLTRAD